MSVISHWGAEIEADPGWLVEEPALTLLQVQLVDAFAEIERMDLVVDKATISVSTSDDGRPHLVIRVSSGQKSTAIPGGVPQEAVYHAPCCPECFMPKSVSQIHPENGCPYGLIEQVMLT